MYSVDSEFDYFIKLIYWIFMFMIFLFVSRLLIYILFTLLIVVCSNRLQAGLDV